MLTPRSFYGRFFVCVFTATLFRSSRHGAVVRAFPVVSAVGVSTQTGGAAGVLMMKQRNAIRNRARSIQTTTTTTTTLPIQTRGGAVTSSTTTKLSASLPVFDNSPLWANQQIILALNFLGFLISLATKSHVHLDLIGTGAFLASVVPAALTLGQSNARIAYSCAAVALWSFKLTSFLFYRALLTKHDARLTTTLSTFGGTCTFWIISAVWGILTALPHTLGTTNAANIGSGWTNGLGLSLFAAGWLMETVADWQKWTFKQSNPGAFCNVGVWKWSQHPNWFGNLLLWVGILVLNLPALVEPVTAVSESSQGAAGLWAQIGAHLWAWRRVGLACLSPLLLWTLFSGQAAGTITDSVNMANQRYGYGKDPVYTDYIDSTPLIFPTKLFKDLFSSSKS